MANAAPRVAVLALSDATWAVLFPLIVIGGLIAIVLWVLLMRNLEEATNARRSGWKRLQEHYAAPPNYLDGPWRRWRQLFMSNRYGDKYAPWVIYVRCEHYVTDAGLALKYRGRLRRRKQPPSHQALLIPWTALSAGSFETLRGHRRAVALFTFHDFPKVALALRPEIARELVAQSSGQLHLDGPPPPP